MSPPSPFRLGRETFGDQEVGVFLKRNVGARVALQGTIEEEVQGGDRLTHAGVANQQGCGAPQQAAEDNSFCRVGINSLYI